MRYVCRFMQELFDVGAGSDGRRYLRRVDTESVPPDLGSVAHEERFEPGVMHICPQGSTHSIRNTGKDDLILLTVVVKR